MRYIVIFPSFYYYYYYYYYVANGNYFGVSKVTLGSGLALFWEKKGLS